MGRGNWKLGASSGMILGPVSNLGTQNPFEKGFAAGAPLTPGVRPGWELRGWPEMKDESKEMWKAVLGVIFCGITLITAAIGVWLARQGAQLVSAAGGEGTINVAVKAVGEVTGINGAVVIMLAGMFILLTAAGNTLKAIAEVKYEVRDALKKGEEPPNRLWTAVKHFNPML